MRGEGGGERGIHYESWHYSHESWNYSQEKSWNSFHGQSFTLLQHRQYSPCTLFCSPTTDSTGNARSCAHAPNYTCTHTSSRWWTPFRLPSPCNLPTSCRSFWPTNFSIPSCTRSWFSRSAIPSRCPCNRGTANNRLGTRIRNCYPHPSRGQTQNTHPRRSGWIRTGQSNVVHYRKPCSLEICNTPDQTNPSSRRDGDTWCNHNGNNSKNRSLPKVARSGNAPRPRTFHCKRRGRGACGRRGRGVVGACGRM